jgi:hypothetical protein
MDDAVILQEDFLEIMSLKPEYLGKISRKKNHLCKLFPGLALQP